MSIFLLLNTPDDLEREEELKFLDYLEDSFTTDQEEVRL